MNRDALKADYIRDDRRRMCEPMFKTNTRRLRERLKSCDTRPGDVVRFECFNDVEAEIVADDLTPEERARVFFSWMFTIPGEGSGSLRRANAG